MTNNTKTPEVTPVPTSAPVPQIAPGVPEQKISKPLIIIAATGTTIAVFALYAWLTWLDYESQPEVVATSTATTEPNTPMMILLFAFVFGVILLPGVIVALIVLPKLLKNRKK